MPKRCGAGKTSRRCHDNAKNRARYLGLKRGDLLGRRTVGDPGEEPLADGRAHLTELSAHRLDDGVILVRDVYRLDLGLLMFEVLESDDLEVRAAPMVGMAFPHVSATNSLPATLTAGLACHSRATTGRHP